MSDYDDEVYLLSEDYRKNKDDLLDDDLDEAALLYDSEEEDVASDNDFSHNELQEHYSIQSPKPSAELQNSAENNIQHEMNTVSGKNSSIVENEAFLEKRGIDDNEPNEDLMVKKMKVLPILTTSESVDEVINSSKKVRTESVELDESILSKKEEHDDDEESDNEDVRGGRFRSERDDAKVSTTSTRLEKREIPDKLELSNEDQQKIEDFNTKEQERRNNRSNRNRGRRRGGRMTRPNAGRGLQGPMPSKHDGRMRMSTQPFMMSHNRMMMSQNRIRPLGFFRAPVRPGMPPFSQPLQIRPPVSLAQGLPQWAGGRILGPMPTVIHPHLIPTHIPPPNMQPITPAPIVSIAASAPPNQPSTIPVIATINRDQPVTKSGTPIPTVNHPIRKPADIDHQNRQVLFENRDSPTLSVKIRRSPSRSRSRSLSPYQRSSHRRTVLRPHRSRRRGKRSPTRKRSRRRTRSYSRSRSRSYSPPSRGRSPRREPQTKPDSANKPKIHINPHFKGPRAIYTATSGTLSVARPAAPTSNPPNLFNVPPPNLLAHIPPPPLPSLLIPPPKTAPPLIPTSKPPVFNPHIPPPTIIQTSAPNPTIPAPIARPPINLQPPNIPRGIPPPNFTNRPPIIGANPRAQLVNPTAHIHPAVDPVRPNTNGRGILPTPPIPRLKIPTVGQMPRVQVRANTAQNAGRLKPPPSNIKSTTLSIKPQVQVVASADYTTLVEKQAQDRRKFLAMKEARRRGKDSPSDAMLNSNKLHQPSGVVKISNLSDNTRPDTIQKLMGEVGPFKEFMYDFSKKCAVGRFENSKHADIFFNKFNRFQVDLSPIMVTLENSS